MIHTVSSLRQQCKDDITKSLEYLHSEERELYSSQHIESNSGNLVTAAEGGLRILGEGGNTFLSSMSSSRCDD